MSGALVVGAAPAPDAGGFYRRLVAEAAAVVAADAAGEWCVALGRVPDVAAGDFDSAAPGAVERLRAAGAEVVEAEADKDESDLDIAVAAALGRFGPPLTLTAAFSGRMDHTLASFGALVRAGAGARVREPGWSAWAVHPGSPVKVVLDAGAVFGVLAPAGAAGVTVTGARWPLAAARLEPLSSLGVSNEADGGLVAVSCEDGVVLVVVPSP